MQTRLRLWPGFPFRRISSAWGTALGSQGVMLVSLGRVADKVRVQRALHLIAPAWAQEPGNQRDWLIQALKEASAQEVRRHRRLVVALPMDRCQAGQFEVPRSMAMDALQADVQLEAAASFNVAPQDIGFDFEVLPTADPLVQGVRWLACLRSEVQAWDKHTRAAGWHLPAVEHQEQAAWRASLALQGGAPNLVAQPHLDWQFSASLAPTSAPPAQDKDLTAAFASMRGSPAWEWLCACGAGLRALS